MGTLIDKFIDSYTNFIEISDKIPEEFQNLYFQRLSGIIYQIRFLTNDIDLCKSKFLRDPKEVEGINLEFYKISNDEIFKMLFGKNVQSP